MKSKTDFVCIEHNIVYVWNYFLLKNREIVIDIVLPATQIQ